MQDFKSRLERLQIDLAECEMIARLTTDDAKQKAFQNLAAHYRDLIELVQREIATRSLSK